MEEMNDLTNPIYKADKNELIFGLFALVCGTALCNFILYGGLNLGFAIAITASVLCAVTYLRSRDCRLSPYPAALLIFSIVICAGFARSDDDFVKLVMLCFLAVSVNLSLCLMAGQNLRDPAGIGSVLDSLRTFLVFGFEGMIPACQGLRQALRSGGPAMKKGGAVLLGLAVMIPILAVMIPLLISADAAFSGVMALLPDFELGELFVTVLFGIPVAIFLYSQAVSLRQKAPFSGTVTEKEISISHLTVNTALMGVCAVFLVYLCSQLAYFGGGFAGILPEKFTMAEYARRGFFEMAWLCAINLGLIALTAALVRRKEGKMPILTRLLCLFIALMTLFFVVSASAKMFMYIGSYGLTRLRVLTEVIMIFLGLATATVALWLFIPKLPYFKVVLLVALVMGATVLWADVDTVVADYNVTAYQSGQLQTVDVGYLASLGDGAKPHIARLVDDPDPKVAKAAKNALTRFPDPIGETKDFRDWNYVNYAADSLSSK